MIVAGEASGDIHGAHLIQALKELRPDLAVFGMGGKYLEAEGVEMLCDASKLAVVGIFEVLGHLSEIRSAMQSLEKRLREDPPQILILIDYPDFNLMLAKKAKAYGIPVFYYISPQVWAWRAGRVKKISRLVDKMAVILPFEKDFYKARGMDVDFVGHPLMDSVKLTMSREEFCAKNNIMPDATIIGILPGSRRKEISSMLPVFLESAKMLSEKRKDIVFLLPLAPTLTMEDLEANGLSKWDIDIRVISGDRYELMASCDAVVAASGTVTLELAILNTPMVVAYFVSPITYFLGRRFITVKYASLVNLVMDSKIVPEFLQDDAVPEKICNGVWKIISDDKYRTRMKQFFLDVKDRLGGPGASMRAAQLILRMIA